jgi:DNA primase catalytic core
MKNERAKIRPDRRREDAVRELALRADIVAVAEELGMRVSGHDSPHPKALCPFHDDHTPSLTFYPGKGSNRGYFHCFTCGIHGDVFALTEQLKKCDFSEALVWLAKRYDFRLPSRRDDSIRRARNARLGGLETALTIYRSQTQEEVASFQQWASSRGFQPDFLTSADVFFARGNKLVSSVGAEDQETLECLVEAGLAYKGSWREVQGSSGPLPMLLPPRDLFSTPRMIFTLRDADREVVGFAGRATGDDLPKYLFSQDFPRSKTLYRLDKVKNVLRDYRTTARESRPPAFDLFVVEGLMDAVRLESLGEQAVAILGSKLAPPQVELILSLAKEADALGMRLVCHLFLDSDDAGRRGTLASLPLLLTAAARGVGFGLDVISVPETEQGRKHDPDDLLRGAVPARATGFLANNCVSVMEVLVISKLGTSIAHLDKAMAEASASLQVSIFRDVERILVEPGWLRVLDRNGPFERWLKKEPPLGLSGWRLGLDSFLRRAASPTEEVLQAAPYVPAERDQNARLLHALQLAQSSTQRRELPVDEGSWERMLGAIDTVLPYFQERLANPPDAARREPMVAVRVPKPGKRELRLKALSCAEDLALQQYMLNELLTDYMENPQFMELVPGVRKWSGNNVQRIATTGPPSLRPADDTYSFAYQIDMDVLSGVVPPRREGMFRPYFECWQDFIAHIDRRVSECDLTLFHVARLDIRGFYDLLPRHAVVDALLPGLEDALRGFVHASSDGAAACGKLFRPDIPDPSQRAKLIVDWLCDQSFDYRYLDPDTGKATSWGSTVRGIPQGPDLSAYLANVALFPLDKVVVEEMTRLEQRLNEGQTEPRRWGAYARYVDDLIIIAPTGNDLSHLRATVEDVLGRLGLELSPKTDALPAMDRKQLRKWLTDRRGAGLGASGPFEGNITSQPLGVLEPLAEVGDIDRSDSLLLLYDVRMDYPQTPPDEVFAAVRLARQADDLRHSDLVVASRRLWRCILDEQAPNKPTTATDAVKAMLKLWEASKPLANTPRDAKVADPDFRTCVILEGLEQFLCSRLDRNPKLSSADHVVIQGWRKKAATWVHEGLCGEVASATNGVQALRHMVELRMLSLQVAASLIVRPARPGLMGIGVEDSPAKARLVISLAQAQESDAPLERAEFRADEPWSDLLLLHESVARLSLASSAHPDPLEQIRQRLERSQHHWVGTALKETLKFWCPAFTGPVRSEFCRGAVFSLRNVCQAPLPELLGNREHLVKALLSEDVDRGLRFLPSPPAVNMPGLLGCEPRQEPVLLHRLDVQSVDPPFCPAGLVWTSAREAQLEGLWRHSSAPLHGWRLLVPGGAAERKERALRWLALAFRSLARKVGDGDTICIPNAYNLLGPDVGEEIGETSEWGVLGYEVRRSSASSQAFIRQGKTGLVPQRVTERYDDLSLASHRGQKRVLRESWGLVLATW